MRTKLSLLFICLIGLIGCLPTQEPVAVTRPVVVTEMPTEVSVSTAVPPTYTPPPTATQVAAATATPTSTPEPAWPTTPILFVRDNALQRWLPQTNEVELLVEGVNYPIYAPDIVVFFRETKPQEEYALIVFHMPTRTEVELFRQPAGEIPNIRTGETRYVPPGTPITVSENGRWLAYVLQNKETETFTLSAHEIQTSTQGVALSQVIFSRELPMHFQWRYDSLTWPTANELSWIEPDGIWITNLDATPPTTALAILGSTNLVLVHPMNPAEQDQEPSLVATTYMPYQWSPDGRFLLAIEYFPGEGLWNVFQIIERDTNQTFELPDSALGPLSDDAVWLDETRILHYKMDGWVRIWQVPPEDEQKFILESEFYAAPPGETLFQVTNLFPLPTNHVRVEDPYSGVFYDLDLNTQSLAVIGENNGPNFDQYFWSPDGQYALGITYINQNDEQIRPVTLIFLQEELSVDIGHVFSRDFCCLYWESAGSE